MTTVTQTDTIGPVQTDWSQTVDFNQFDPSSGSLTAVGVGLTATVAGTLTVTNNDLDTSTVYGYVAGSVVVADAGNQQLVSVSPSAATEVTLATGQSLTLPTITDTETASTSYVPSATGTIDAAFVGTGQVPLTTTAQATVTIDGPANMAVTAHTSADANVSLQYDYGTGTGGSGNTYTEGFTAFTSIGGNAAFTILGDSTTTQTFIFADKTVGWSNSLSVDQFNPSLGRLDAVMIAITSDLTGSVSVENLGAGAGWFSTTQAGILTLGGGTLAQTIQSGNTLLDSGNLAAFDGTADLAGSSAANSGLLTNTGTSTATLNDATSLALFTGAGTLDLGLASTGDSQLSGDGNLMAALTAENGATITVTYEYAPAASLACFAAGTRIATDRGEVVVEALRDGDRVRTLGGGVSAVVWLGHRCVDCRRHPHPEDVWPVRVVADAFGPGLPLRDLFLSPDHAVFVDGVLVPVRYLVNGRTIARAPRATVTYWHVELERHDVILAEGLPCESYLDTGNRGAFANGGPSVQLHPDFARHVWQAEACAPLVVGGAEVEAVRSLVLARAEALGHVRTRDADLRLRIGRAELPVQAAGERLRFLLPPACDTVRLVSRSAVPAELEDASPETRRLGVAVSALWLDGEPVALDGAKLRSGWHAAEPDWRWTDGDAEVDVIGARTLDVAVALTGVYWRDGAGRGALCAGRKAADGASLIRPT